MALNANVWSSVSDLKVYLGITVSTFDTVLEDLLNQSADAIERFLGRDVKDLGSDITEFHDGDDGTNKDTLYLRNFPVNALTSVSFRTGAIGSPTFVAFNANDFVRDDETGTFFFGTGFRGLGGQLPDGRQNIRVIYQGGYTSGNVPNDLVLALNKMASAQFTQRKSQGIDTEKVGSISVKWSSAIGSSLLASGGDVAQLLIPYKRFF